MQGTPDMAADFTHFDYVNPDAPKGGRLSLSALGTFDSLNPFVVRGSATPFVRAYVFESLLVRSYDEPFTLYGLLARTVKTDDERSFVEFEIDPRARFSDGTPVTADDVLFSFGLLRDKGRPNMRLYYGKVASATADGSRVRFTFTEPDRELPLIMGLMPVLPRHAVDAATFDQTSLTPPVGSGPYTVAQVEAGSAVTLKRNPDYWAKDLPVTRGLFNFDELRFTYFRDANTEFEAFRRGLIDARFETDPGRWQTGYDFPAVRNGQVVKESIPNGLPKPHYALVFNTRRPVFADVRVRRAIIELFDFEWLDRNFYYNLYNRTAGFFDGSDLSSLGRKANAAELALLGPHHGELRPDVMDGTYRPPAADGSGRDRKQLKAALALFAQAGWQLKDGKLRRVGSDETFGFEIMVTSREQERLALGFASQMQRAGMRVDVRVVDAVQFDARRNAYDFDMVPFTWTQSLSPGNEQAFYFGSAAADMPGTRNYMGAKSPAVDAAIAALMAARSEDDVTAAARALDRALISGAYGVPLFHAPGQWLARWIRIAHPARPSLYGTLPETWWRAR
ncbi:ABC transporter substrate-binding protein [Azorhizobium oxalatiphilum]|uniref:ABC transporter substrate-binding protein n=2 Tax=Azorhizobium oxalatiphilum TaxID=980631 RepID=A0A917FEC7_9HYPH|nr:extracellular solute-binding protein [Azorhizobium oxalatiphilum]GGF73308.1 ABC transporter substrate-binding protein [Azorhizobium oxalatiphilum]